MILQQTPQHRLDLRIFPDIFPLHQGKIRRIELVVAAEIGSVPVCDLDLLSEQQVFQQNNICNSERPALPGVRAFDYVFGLYRSAESCDQNPFQ